MTQAVLDSVSLKLAMDRQYDTIALFVQPAETHLGR